MANQTTNYNLNKPVRGERNYDVLLNENADIIDTQVKANENKIGNLLEKIYWGNGSPEGVVTANQGSLYLRQDGGASTTLYIKESGTGNIGWVAK